MYLLMVNIILLSVTYFMCFVLIGLNVFSMLKHDTLVLTLAAVERIEKQMLFFMHRYDRKKLAEKFQLSQV